MYEATEYSCQRAAVELKQMSDYLRVSTAHHFLKLFKHLISHKKYKRVHVCVHMFVFLNVSHKIFNFGQQSST